MSEHTSLGSYAIAALKRRFTLIPREMGADAHLRKAGITFDTEKWTIQNIGHFCTMRMNAFFGLMKMETVVISPFTRDLPLINLDRVKAFGKETQIVELYDIQLRPWPEESQEEFARIARKYDDMEEYESGEHWYDRIMYPCSFHKKGKNCADRLDKAAGEYIDVYAEQLSEADRCDLKEKRALVRDFAGKLVENGGSAVNTMTGLFGAKATRRMVIRHMYGC